MSGEVTNRELAVMIKAVGDRVDRAMEQVEKVADRQQVQGERLAAAEERLSLGAKAQLVYTTVATAIAAMVGVRGDM